MKYKQFCWLPYVSWVCHTYQDNISEVPAIFALWSQYWFRLTERLTQKVSYYICAINHIRYVSKKWRRHSECFSERMFAAQLCWKSEGFFQRSGRLLPNSGGFAHTDVSETWCSFAYGSFGAVFASFWASFVTAKQQNNGSGFCKHAYRRAVTLHMLICSDIAIRCSAIQFQYTYFDILMYCIANNIVGIAWTGMGILECDFLPHAARGKNNDC